MWRKIYNAIWADKARRAAVLTIIIALIVSGTALAILNTIGKSKPAQGIPDEQPLIGTEVADLPQESSRNTNQETESQPADERQTEQSGEQYETPEVTGPQHRRLRQEGMNRVLQRRRILSLPQSVVRLSVSQVKWRTSHRRLPHRRLPHRIMWSRK